MPNKKVKQKTGANNTIGTLDRLTRGYERNDLLGTHPALNQKIVEKRPSNNESIDRIKTIRKHPEKILNTSNKDNVIRSIIPDVITECSIASRNDPNSPCSSQSMISIIKEFLNISASNPKDIIEEAKKHTKCDSERCVVNSVAKSANGQISAQARKELIKSFKLKGHTDVTLLSNFDIDGSQKQWTDYIAEYFPYNFNMVDFEKYGGSLATIDVYDLCEQGYKTLSCVINSDVHTRGGEHWMALFVDMRSTTWTVEFFNSSGSPPVIQFTKWLVDTKNRLEDYIRDKKLSNNVEVISVSEIKHQDTRTECGVYSLFYIFARLNNIPYEYFMKNKVHDDLMFEFRQHLFYDPSRENLFPDGKFNYEKFKANTKILWE